MARSERARKVAEIGLFAAFYAVLTWLVAPIAYDVFQFRISEFMKSLTARRKHLIWAFVIGNALSNIFSPFGIMEYTWMPFMNLIGAALCYYVGGYLMKGSLLGMVTGGFLYSVTVAFGVAVMLSGFVPVPLYMLFLYVLVPEVVLICFVGAPICYQIAEKMRWYP